MLVLSQICRESIVCFTPRLDHSIVDNVADSVFSTAVDVSVEEEDVEDPPNANTNPSGIELLIVMELLDDDSD